jgi:uncharacterized membrane protein
VLWPIRFVYHPEDYIDPWVVITEPEGRSKEETG